MLCRLDPQGLPRPSLRRQVSETVMRSPCGLIVFAVAAACSAGFLLGGVVAAAVSGAYSVLAVRALRRRARRRSHAAVRSRSLDDLCALAADLRAGLPPPFGAGEGGDPRISELTAAVWRLAERTGAPAADLVERIEADARAADRARVIVSAEAAGAQATALLLAALPVAGIALGQSMGIDAVGVLLHTTLGGACAVAAVVLQCLGLLWSERLVNGSA
jgi:tight adherence protein B